MKLPVPHKENKHMEDRKTIIVDIDGTVALRVDRSPFDYSKCDTDIPNANVLNLVISLIDEVNVIFLSGREDSCKDMTIEWLDKHLPEFSEYSIYMRAAGDHRNDAIIKKEIYESFIKPKHNVWFVLDDRDRVVKMWRELGLTCLQVEYGNF